MQILKIRSFLYTIILNEETHKLQINQLNKNLIFFRAKNNQCGRKKTDFKRFVKPEQKPHIFVKKSDHKESLLTRVKKNFKNNEIRQRINEHMLEVLFNSTRADKYGVSESEAYKSLVKKLSYLDYFKVQDKYLYYLNEVTANWGLSPAYFKNSLLAENITKDDIKTIHQMKMLIHPKTIQ